MGKMRPFVVTFCGLLLVAQSANVWAQIQSHAVVVSAVKHALAPPLRQTKPVAPSVSASVVSDQDATKAAVLQSSATSDSSAASALQTTAGLNILGMGYGFPNYSIQDIIPSTNGAAGTTQFVQFVNDSFTVFNKSTGSVMYGPADINTLWQSLGSPCSAYDNMDGIAQFDKLADVWVMLMPIYGSPYLCVAVSTTSDATGSWNLYAFELPLSSLCNCRTMQDYPKLAVWPDAYYISYHQALNLIYEGPAACAVDRAAMLAGTAAATMQCFTENGTSYNAWLPSDLDGTVAPPSGSPNYFLAFDPNDKSLDLWQFHVDWTTPANSTFTGPTNIPVPTFLEPCGDTVTVFTPQDNCVPQVGTTQMLGAFGDELMYRVAYRNFGSYQALVANHTVQVASGSDQTGIRWYELQDTGSGFGLYQDGTYAPDSNYRWMGSIAMDHAGDIAVGYNVSGSTMSPSIRYTGQMPTDPLGTMEAENDVLAAADVESGSLSGTPRWGDYSSLAVDPSDDCTFWFTTEYVPAGTNHWATRIASFSFPNCTGTQTPSFTVSATPSSQTVNPGGSTSYTTTVSPVDGFSGTVSLTVSGCPANTTCTLNPTSVTLPSTESSTLTVQTTSTTPTGTYTLTITGTSGSTVEKTSVTLVVQVPVTGWTIVNKASGGGQHATNLTIPSTGTGHLLAVALMFNGSASVSSVSDNAGNTYVSGGARVTLSGWSVEIWYAASSKAGATLITPAFSGSPTYVAMSSWEVSGLGTSKPDAANTSTGTVASNTPGAAVTTTQAGDFVVSAMFVGGTTLSGITSGNSFTSDYLTGGNGWAHLTSNAAAAGTQQASWSCSSPAGKYLSSTVAFLVAP